MESDATVQENDSLKPSTSPSSTPTTLIPLSPYLDTLSLLCVLILLPEWLGCAVLLFSILLGSSRLILGRCLSLIFTNMVTNNIHTHQNYNSNLEGIKVSLLAPVLTSLIIDLLILFTTSLVVQYSFTNLIRITLYAVIASSLASYKTKTLKNTVLAVVTIVALQMLYSFALRFFDLSGYTTTEFTQTYLTLKHLYYLKGSWRFTWKFLIEFTNTLLSIHICILGSPATKFFPFTSYTIPLNEISGSLNQSNHHNGQTYVRSENDILSIHVPKYVSESFCPNLINPGDFRDDEGVPASYPHEQLSNIEDISCSSLVVTQNFENYCVLPSSNKKSIKRKASVRFCQPLWSLLVAIKAMIVAPGAYSGEDKSSALILYSSSLAENVTCYVFLTTETAIGLELVGCRPSKLDVVVKINGVMWYQQDSIRFKESTIYVKISMLSRLSEYHVEVLYDLGNGEMESLANLIVSTSSSNSTLQPIRTSPLITLQQSLETTRENINREKQNLKKLKKENQKKLAGYRNDITTRKLKLNTEKDERNHRKIMALKNTVALYELEYSKVNDQIMELYSMNTEMEEIFQDRKREFDLQFRELDKVQKDYEIEKMKYMDQMENYIQNLETVQSKNDRLSKKSLKIHEEVNAIQLDVKNMFERDTNQRKEIIETKLRERNNLLNQLKLELSKLDKELELLVTDNDMLKKQAI